MIPEEAAYLNAGTAIIQVLSDADVTNSGALESPMNSASLVLAGITVE